MKPSHVDKVLDVKGLYCPEPIMLLHEIIREASPGDIVLVKATDPSTERDIPKFCRFLGHELISLECRDHEFNFWLKKGVAETE